jgi:hypothetical protein
MKPVGRGYTAGVYLCAVLLFVGYEVQKIREKPPTPNPRSFPISSRSPEARLASIQLGQRIRWKDSTTRRFEFLLDLLAADCPADNERRLADLTIRSIRELSAAGVSSSPTEVLGGVSGLYDIGGRPTCASFFERYVTQRLRGSGGTR